MEQEIKIEVKKCKGCPFSEKDFERELAYCYAPTEIHKNNYDINKYYDFNLLAPFCPLKGKKLVITN